MTIVRRYHPTTSFLLFAGVTVLLGIGAINSQNNLLFFCFGLALAALLVSGFVSGSALMRVRLARTSVSDAYVGAPLRIVYEVRHLGRGLPAFALHIEEREGAVRRGVPEWTWRTRMPRPSAFMPFVARGRAAHAEAVVIPTRRGEATLGEARIVTTFPFGAIRKSVSFVPSRGSTGDTGITRVLVRPAIVDLPPWLARQTAAAHRDAETASARVGRGDEFFGLREYTPGDSVRRIAWRATARLGELVVREDAAFESTRIVFVLRPSREDASPARDERDERAISLVASAVVRSSRAGLAVGLAAPGAGLFMAPATGDAAAGAMLDALAQLDLASPTLDRARADDPRFAGMTVVVVDADALDDESVTQRAREVAA